ncbi:DUF3375 family protein [Isoptericola sp. NPDC019571]|uniref:DUF3375 family protein n=1 Tax=Isoptericola sp. NPDC019571 TaxID=3364008 RepID=UPI0037B44249
MSDVVGQYARVRAAFDQPTLTLLNRPGAPVAVTLLRTCFSREVTSIDTARMHQLISNHLIDLRGAGATQVPDLDGRELCMRWVKGEWLYRDNADGGGQVYTLTSHAQTALALVDSLEHDRPTLSEHRIATIVDTVRRFNASANPSREARVLILDDRINELVAERDRLEAGGELAPVTEDYMVQGFIHLLSLVAALPSDFARVTERFEVIRKQILDDFRSEEHAAGAVVDAYLRRADELTTTTAEGRAFEGAFTLLRNDALLLQLREDLNALLSHPHADALDDMEKRELRSTVAVVRRGLEDVLTQRSRATKAIKDYITTHDVVRDRQLDSTLRALDAEFGPWLARTGVRHRVPVELLPEPLDIDYLPRKFHDPDGAAPPAPLSDPADDDDDASEESLADMIAWGGPSLDALAEALATGYGDSVGELFNALDPSLRRPVDVLGILHLADSTFETDPDGADLEGFEAVRPDGTMRRFATARTALPTSPDQEATQ